LLLANEGFQRFHTAWTHNGRSLWLTRSGEIAPEQTFGINSADLA